VDNAVWYEYLWTAMGLLWTSMTVWGSWTAWEDYRYLRAHPDPDPATQQQDLDTARGYLRYETSSLYGGLLITFLGVRALLLPPNPGSPDEWTVVAGLGAIGYAAIKTLVSVQNRLARRHFDRSLQ
jgi:hypothetical protein